DPPAEAMDRRGDHGPDPTGRMTCPVRAVPHRRHAADYPAGLRSFALGAPLPPPAGTVPIHGPDPGIGTKARSTHRENTCRHLGRGPKHRVSSIDKVVDPNLLCEPAGCFRWPGDARPATRRHHHHARSVMAGLKGTLRRTR